MKVELSKNMIIAMQIALDELSNSGDWEWYLEGIDVESVYDGINQLRKVLDYN